MLILNTSREFSY